MGSGAYPKRRHTQKEVLFMVKRWIQSLMTLLVSVSLLAGSASIAAPQAHGGYEPPEVIQTGPSTSQPSPAGTNAPALAHIVDRDAYFLTLLEGKEPATDSASAATALATGYKTDAGNIAWLPGDPITGSLTTIAQSLRADYGFAIGAASTVQFSHATPASLSGRRRQTCSTCRSSCATAHNVDPSHIAARGALPDGRAPHFCSSLGETLRESASADVNDQPAVSTFLATTSHEVLLSLIRG
jgi:hypothetical protein